MALKELTVLEAGDEGWVAVAKVLKRTRLISLNLRVNQIGKEGAKALAGMICKTRLNQLQLCGNHIDKETKDLLPNNARSNLRLFV